MFVSSRDRFNVGLRNVPSTLSGPEAIRAYLTEMRDALVGQRPHYSVLTLTSSAYSMRGVDDIVIAGTGAALVSLPSATSFTGHLKIVKNVSGGVLTVTPIRGEYLEGGASYALSAGSALRVVSDSVEWWEV